MLTGLLLASILAALAVMSGAFLVARDRKRIDTVDLAWGLAFVVTASTVAGYSWKWRTALVAVLVDVWAVRLVSHLAERAKGSKEDLRYKAISKKWKGNYWLQAYVRIFLVQAAFVWVISLPVVLASGKNNGPWVVWLVVGVLVWLKGFAVETLADRQLATFKAAGEGKVLKTGLWRYSRHPNYYGEITQWLGIALIACGARYGWIGLVGPLTLAATIVFISGIPPIEKRHAGDLEYQRYKLRTSPLIPWFPKK